jgi:hypothetical protein
MTARLYGFGDSASGSARSWAPASKRLGPGRKVGVWARWGLVAVRESSRPVSWMTLGGRMGVEGFPVVGRSVRGGRALVFAVVAGLSVLWALAGSAAAALPSGCSVSGNTVTCSLTFNSTGGPQTWIVPAGVTSATFDVQGAQGGSEFESPGGLGGEATAALAVTPGATVTLVRRRRR